MLLKTVDASHGFTFIELLIAIVIVGILARLAYPSYLESVRKSKRSEGRAALMQVVQQQELYFSRHNSYIAFSHASTDAEEKKFRWYSGSSPKKSAYEIKAEACENEKIQDCVVLTATPGTANVDVGFTDPVCGALSMTSSGVTKANSPDCWK